MADFARDYPAGPGADRFTGVGEDSGGAWRNDPRKKLRRVLSGIAAGLARRVAAPTGPATRAQVTGRRLREGTLLPAKPPVAPEMAMRASSRRTAALPA